MKYSFIFAFLGFKRNVLALIGQIALVAIVIALIMTGALMALGAVLPLVILFGIGLFMGYYASYKVIKKYMIDNASADKSADSEQASAETPEQAGANDVGGNVNAGGRFENGRWISDDE